MSLVPTASTICVHGSAGEVRHDVIAQLARRRRIEAGRPPAHGVPVCLRRAVLQAARRARCRCARCRPTRPRNRQARAAKTPAPRHRWRRSPGRRRAAAGWCAGARQGPARHRPGKRARWQARRGREGRALVRHVFDSERRPGLSEARVHAAFSRSGFQAPLAARPFILARWVKARWPAATFSALPSQALSAAACSARP